MAKGTATVTRTVTTTQTVTQTVGAAATNVKRRAQLVRCLRAAGLKVQRNPPPASDADRAAVPQVPAEHLGVVVFPNDTYYDMWLARSPDDAQRTAEIVDEESSAKMGVEVAPAAASGLVAIALAADDEAPDLDLVKAQGKCMDEVSRF